jgi:hypothetical protein
MPAAVRAREPFKCYEQYPHTRARDVMGDFEAQPSGQNLYSMLLIVEQS